MNTCTTWTAIADSSFKGPSMSENRGVVARGPYGPQLPACTAYPPQRAGDVGRVRGQQASKSEAKPCPPPTHMVTIP